MAEGGAVAAIATTQLICTMPQQHDSGSASVAPPRAVYLALSLRRQPQGCSNVEVHDCVRRAQQVCVAPENVMPQEIIFEGS